VSLEGRGREGKTKKEETSERSREVWEERSLEGDFFFITRKPLNLGELKNCIGWGFGGGLKGLYEFFKFN
jgi:hypothetical protein